MLTMQLGDSTKRGFSTAKYRVHKRFVKNERGSFIKSEKVYSRLIDLQEPR
jgi:hypothetical protein